MTTPIKLVFDAIDNASGTIDKLSSKVDDVGGSTGGLVEANGGLFASIEGLVAAAGPYVAILGAAYEGLMLVTDASAAAEETQVRLYGTLQSTNRWLEITSDTLTDMANTAMRGSIFDDEAILEASNVLMRFSSIASSSIPKVTGVVLDMATALQMDLPSAADAFGRALETGAIPRTWGFSSALKAQFKAAVEAGDAEEALTILTDELTNRFGGQALNALATYTGATAALGNEWENTLEKGNDVLPVLTLLKLSFADLLVIVQDSITENAGLADSLREIPTDELEADLEEIKRKLQTTTSYTETYTLVQAKLAAETELSNRATRGWSQQLGLLPADLSQVSNEVGGLNLQLADSSDLLASMNRDYSKFVTSVLDVQGAVDKYNEKMAELAAQQAEVNAELAAGNLSADEAAEKLASIGEAAAQASLDLDKWRDNFIFSMMQAKLAADGMIDQTDMQALMTVGEGLGMIDQDTVDRMNKIAEVMDAMNPANAQQAADAIKAIMEAPSAKTITVTIYENTITTETTGQATGGLIPGSPSEVDTVPRMLAQGEFVVRSRVVAMPGVLEMLQKLNAGQLTSPANQGGRVDRSTSISGRNYFTIQQGRRSRFDTVLRRGA